MACAVDGCLEIIFSGGLCSKHYNRKRLRGTTDDGPRARASLRDRLWRQIKIGGPDECWPWTSRSNVKGYGVISEGGRSSKKLLAHRAVWLVTNGPLPDLPGHHGAVVMHSCDNRLCCNPAHLLVGSQGDNVVDMDRKGRRVNAQLKGSQHHNAKLTESDVIAIRADTRSQRAIASEFGISRQNVRFIKRRLAWKHI
jgi:DNA-binding CsgD family transcriptional regulator